MSHGLTLNANYTWAKALTDIGLNGYLNVRSKTSTIARSSAETIRPFAAMSAIFSYIYELPIGRGTTAARQRIRSVR